MEDAVSQNHNTAKEDVAEAEAELKKAEEELQKAERGGNKQRVEDLDRHVEDWRGQVKDLRQAEQDLYHQMEGFSKQYKAMPTADKEQDELATAGRPRAAEIERRIEPLLNDVRASVQTALASVPRSKVPEGADGGVSKMKQLLAAYVHSLTPLV